MYKYWRLTVVVLMAAGLSLGAAGGCSDKKDSSVKESQSEHPKGEHPEGDHPKGAH